MNKYNIMITGVGGQGTLLASRIIGTAAIKKGYDVKLSEVHGMAQRGGSVVTYAKLATKVYSPIIEKGETDIIMAFEMLEALRWIDYLKPEGTIIINEQRIDPMPVITGAALYPENIKDKISRRFKNVVAIDALLSAKKSGSTKSVNIVMIGIMAKFTTIDKQIWIESVRENVPDKFLDINLKAFEEGYNYKIK